MDRRAAASRLTDGAISREWVGGDVVFTVATSDDEPEVRRLLAENPVGGRFGISLEREPDAFAADFNLAEDQVFILARPIIGGPAFGLCERVVWDAFVDGVARRLPYLGALRVASDHRHRIGIPRGGFRALRELAEDPDDLPFALTSIASDNYAARRLLAAGLPGMPNYRPIGEFSTFALRPRPSPTEPFISAAQASDLPAISAFLRKNAASLQFVQNWTEEKLEGLAAFGLRPEDFLVARDGGVIRAVLAVWDQRAFRQTVIRRYPRPLGLFRPLLNIVAPLTRMPRLPPLGTPSNQATLSHLAASEGDSEAVVALVAAALDQAARRGFDAALIGFATERRWRAALFRFKGIEYRTTLHLAYWPEAAAQVEALGDAIPHPELGLL